MKFERAGKGSLALIRWEKFLGVIIRTLFIVHFSFVIVEWRGFGNDK
jgi:hypothetical protein